MLAALRPAIGFDAHVFLLTDPATTVGHSPHAEVPCLPRLPEAIRLKYLTTVNRWTSLRRDQVPVGRLHRATGGELSRSPLWRELLQDFGISDVAVRGVRRPARLLGIPGSLADRRRAFSDDDVALLADVAPTDLPGAAGAPGRGLHDAGHRCGRGERTGRDPAGRPVADHRPDVRGHRLVSDAAADPPQQTPIPAAVYNVAAQLLAVRAGVDDHDRRRDPTVAGQHLGDVARQSTASTATPVSRRHRGVDRRDLGRSAIGPVRPLLRSQHPGTSSCSTLLGRGADTRDIAVEMAISDYTVQDHLKSIFAKTALTSRGALITTALGPRATVPRAGATAGCGDRRSRVDGVREGAEHDRRSGRRGEPVPVDRATGVQGRRRADQPRRSAVRGIGGDQTRSGRLPGPGGAIAWFRC